MAGRNVVATRIEGLCESIAAIDSDKVQGTNTNVLNTVTPQAPAGGVSYTVGGRNYLFG